MRVGWSVFFASLTLAACVGHMTPDPDPDWDPPPPPPPDPGPAHLAVVDTTGQPITELTFGDTNPQLFHITNHGTGPSKTLSLGITGDAVDDFTVDPFTTCDHRVLDAGASCDVVLDYQPQTSELRTATLTIAEAAGSS